MATIMIDPVKLGELSEWYSNTFDTKYKDITERYGETIGKLSTTWEGEEANTANESYEKIKAAFGRIEERSNDMKQILGNKTDGFNETVDKARTGFTQVNDVSNIKF